VARESPEPTASQFARVAQEIDLGTNLAEAFARLVPETGSPDYELMSAIVSVQHEAGGNLAQALDAVAETLRERIELRDQVNALTAQQRLSSVVLTMLPIGLFLFLLVTNRPFVEPLLVTLVGRLLLLLVGLFLVCGWVVMRSVGRVAE
jgi:tight adherence protein B